MKKLNLILAMALASAMVFMTSCKGDDDDLSAPSVSFDNPRVDPVASGIYDGVTGTVDAPGGIDKITFWFNNTELKKENVILADGFDKWKKGDTKFTFKYTLKGLDGEGQFKIVVTDKQDPAKTGDGVLTIGKEQQGEDPEPKPQIVTSGELKLFTATGDKTGNEHYISFENYTTYKYAGAVEHASSVDMGYYNGNYTKATSYPHFFSPEVAPSEIDGGKKVAGANTTTFQVLTEKQVASLQAGSMPGGLNISESNVEVAPGKFIAFKTSKNIIGAIQVLKVQGTYGRNDYITFKVHKLVGDLGAK